MDERKIKRLLAMLAMASVAIMLAKYMLTRTVTALGQADLAHKRAAAAKPLPIPVSAPVPAEPMPASAVVADAASAVESADARP